MNVASVDFTQRLALGLEPLDAQRRHRVATVLDVEREGKPGTLEPVRRHDSCVHAFLQRPTLASPFNLRLTDDSRRYVPRRLSVPLALPASTKLSPGLVPGAAYDCTSRATGIRGSVTRAGQAMRWARVEARLPADTAVTGTVVGRAHGDDRGEFLLLLGVEAAAIGDLPPTIDLEVVVYGPLPTAPVPATVDLPSLDPFWDLPLEVVPAVAPDNVTPGLQLPPGYDFTTTSHPTVSFDMGRLKSIPPIVFQ
jgi:hypothetical protein